MRHLRFDDFAPGKPYHAALVAVEGYRARGFQVTEHTHDFYELMCVLAGEALHRVNGTERALRSGELILLRPGDRHSVRFQSGRLLHYINIAISAAFWTRFRDMTNFGLLFEAEGEPRLLTLSDPQATECAGAFRRALEWFEESATGPHTDLASRLEATRLLSTVVPLLLNDSPERERTVAISLPTHAPIWLSSACRTLQQDPDRLHQGLPAFVALTGVTPTHLARVLKAATGLTPTEYINGLRLDRAARLLTTTTLSLFDIAAECGFEQPSYFYRLFRARFRTTPQAYRFSAARRVAPEKERPLTG